MLHTCVSLHRSRKSYPGSISVLLSTSSNTCCKIIGKKFAYPVHQWFVNSSKQPIKSCMFAILRAKPVTFLKFKDGKQYG